MVALAVVGSPRDGNTARAAAELLDSLGGGATIALPDCRGVEPIADCRACIAAGACTLRDDFSAVMSRVYEADPLILATPLYWYGPSAQLKAFLDRWSCLLDREEDAFRARMRGKRVVLLIAQGERGFYEAALCLQQLEWTIRYLDMALVGRIVVVGHARGDFAADGPQREAVRAAGRAFVAGRPADVQPPWFHMVHQPGAPLGGVYTP